MSGVTYPQAGTYTATWNGTSLVSSVTSGGQVITTHAGTVIASMACPPQGAIGTANDPAGTQTYAAVPV